MIIARLQQYLYLMRLNKPIGILLLLWPTLWALWLAMDGQPQWNIVAIFVAGVVLMRTAGCIINDIVDRSFDKHVTRTRHRPLATGKVSLPEAFLLFALLVFAAFVLVLFCNLYTVVLAFIGLAIAVIYPFLKRITHLPQLGLGAAFAWGVPMAFAAETNAISFSGWMLFFTTLIWIVIYDTFYGMADRPDDVKIGVKSAAILLGGADRKILFVLQVIFTLLLIWLGRLFDLNKFYYAALPLVVALLIYQQYLIRAREPQQCFRAFLNNNWVGFVIFLGVVIGLG